MNCTIGTSGLNITKMRQILNFLLGDSRPFIISADWNMPPCQLSSSASGWLKQLDASIVVPKGTEASCSSGRLLDYCVISNSLMQAIEVDFVYSLPWGTHLGVNVQILKKPAGVATIIKHAPRKACTSCRYIGACSIKLLSLPDS